MENSTGASTIVFNADHRRVTILVNCAERVFGSGIE